MDAIVSIISNVGFPIAACVAMFVYGNKILSEFREVIQNNTAICVKVESSLNALYDYIDSRIAMYAQKIIEQENKDEHQE